MFLPAQIIRKKRDGHDLTPFEIEAFIGAYTRGTIPDYQMSALLMSIFLKGMTAHETAALTKAMLESGSKVDLSKIKTAKIDKHSTGGVGDKTSLVLAPILASLDVAVPMIAGRGLGHTGGTVDKLEAIPGIKTELSLTRFSELVASVGTAMITQSEEIAPADRKIYALRDVTGTVESIPLIVSSIMSKKLAEDFDGVVLDVKCGNGAFMKTPAVAKKLAKALVNTTKEAKKLVSVLITDMSQPLGHSAGNAIEINECVEFLRRGPADPKPEPRFESLTLALALEMLALAAKAQKQKFDPKLAAARIRDSIQSGRAYAKFLEMISLQGGDTMTVDRGLPLATKQIEFKSTRSGFLRQINTEQVGLALVALGGGRKAAGQAIDHSVGFRFHKTLGQPVKRGESLVTIYASDEPGANTALDILNNSYLIASGKPQVPKLILGRIR